MKNVFGMIIAVGLLRFTFSAYAEEPLKIWEQCGRNGITNQWFLSAKQFQTLPKWNPLKRRPPLSLRRAVKIGARWVQHQVHRNAEPIVNTIALESVPFDDARGDNVFVYKILFYAAPFDFRGCVVLMDGSVLEPHPLGKWEWLDPKDAKH